MTTKRPHGRAQVVTEADYMIESLKARGYEAGWEFRDGEFHVWKRKRIEEMMTNE